jgi:hypothetical protein
MSTNQILAECTVWRNRAEKAEKELKAIDDYIMKNCDPEQILEINRIMKGGKHEFN